MRKTLLVCLTVAILVVSSALFPTFVSAAEANVSPASLSFGQITVNTQSSFLTMHVYNENRHTILISRIYSTAPEFLVKSPSLPLELAPHATASFEVAFAPNSASSFSGNVIVSVQGRNGSTYSVSVPIAGTGKAVSTTTPSVLTGSASSLSFGSALVGASASQTLTLANSGTAPIAITGMTASGSGFAYSNFSATETLLAGQSIYVTVTFTPTVVGNVTGSLNIVSNASNPSVAIPLTGIGIQPQISVTPASISFGNVSVGVADTQSLTIKNTGTANLIVSSASLAGSSFSLSGMTTPMTLAPGASSTITPANGGLSRWIDP